MPSIQICQKCKFVKYANWNYEKYKNAIKAKNMQTIHLCKTKTGIFWILSKPRRKWDASFSQHSFFMISSMCDCWIWDIVKTSIAMWVVWCEICFFTCVNYEISTLYKWPDKCTCRFLSQCLDGHLWQITALDHNSADLQFQDKCIL